jgi:hypothetical protein
MIRSWTTLGAVAALLSGCSPEPCASCLLVNGTYNEIVTSTSVDCHDGLLLRFGGPPDQSTVTQGGSTLTLDGPQGMQGVLHSDMSASFGPIPATAEPIDAAGNPDPNGSPSPGKLYLEGWFVSDKGHATSFSGTYVFIADADGCEIDSLAQWTR